MGGKPKEEKELLALITKNYEQINELMQSTIRILEENMRIKQENEDLIRTIEGLKDILGRLSNEQRD